MHCKVIGIVMLMMLVKDWQKLQRKDLPLKLTATGSRIVFD